MGRVEAARRGGAFIEGLIEDQPVTSGKFYLLRNAAGEIIREDRQQGLAMVSSIDIGTPGQVYWYIGMAMNACASLYLATGETRWRDTGYKAFALFENCADDIYEIISNGKYIILPPSLHQSGKQYEWELSSSPIEEDYDTISDDAGVVIGDDSTRSESIFGPLRTTSAA